MMIHVLLECGWQHFFHKRRPSEGNKTWGHWHKINLENQSFSQVDKGLYNVYKYIGPNPLEIIIVVHQFCRALWHQKKTNCTAKWNCYFLPWLPNMSNRFCHLLTNFFPLSKQPWVCSLHMSSYRNNTIYIVILN